MRFPILIKILDASETLSLQVHPGRPGTINDLAEPKTEFWYFVATDEGAGSFYEKLGFTKAGVIPDYALKPYGGLCGTIIYWKRIGAR